jgi:predicted site-specific integrase-resolvase
VKLISPKEACARLGISARTLELWRSSGEFCCSEFGGRLNFDAREVEDFKRRRRRGGNGGQP